MIRRTLLGMLGLVLAIAAPAGAQIVDPTILTLLGDPSVQLISVRTAPLHASGAITVTFGPDAASGCAAHAGCAYRGQITLTPGPAGALEMVTFSLGGRRETQAGLLLDNTGSGAAVTYSDVRRASGQECADATGVQEVLTGRRAGVYAFSLADALGATRCAGPLAADLAAALPHFALSRTGLLKGGRIDLRQTRTFASHGFAGTVTSTLVLTLGTARKPVRLTGPPSPRARRLRVVRMALSVTGSRSVVTLGVRGSANPSVCALLDSCGLVGTITLHPQPSASSGAVSAYGAVNRPRRDFLTALGLARDGRTKGIQVIGGLEWQAGGTVSSTVRQGPECTDTAPLGGGLLLVGSTGHGLAVYAPFSPFARTRCPGPVLGSGAEGLFGAGAVFSRGAVTIALRPFASLADDGYAISQHGSVTLTLHRGSVTSRVIADPFS